MDASVESMKVHVKVLGWLYLLLGILGLVGAACILVIVAGAGLISGDSTAIAITTTVAVSVSGLVGLLSLPGVITGLGLIRFKTWARVLGAALGVLNLPGFPTGTILGLYSLIVLLSSSATPVFEQPQSG